MSKSGGLTVVPVTATRTGCATLPSPRPFCVARSRNACSSAGAPSAMRSETTRRASMSSGLVSGVRFFFAAASS